jgi:hypothetical protein
MKLPLTTTVLCMRSVLYYTHKPDERHKRRTISTLRRGSHKLIYYYKNQYFELFDLNNDIGEKNNIADSKPYKVKFLARKPGRYLRKADARRPAFTYTDIEAP